MEKEKLNFSQLESFVHRILDDAQKISEKYFRKQFQQQKKADLSPVTEADLAIEVFLREKLTKNYPNIGFWGEETKRKDEGQDFYWLVDPIDGTKSFMTGLPIFATLLALFYKEQPVFGVIENPILKERWWAWNPKFLQKEGNFSFLSSFSSPVQNSKLLLLKNSKTLKEATLASTTPFMFVDLPPHFLPRLNEKIFTWRWAGDAYNYALLVEGFLDAVVEAKMQFYDCGALIPNVLAVGGCISDWEGQQIQPNFCGQVVASANPALHQELLLYLSLFAQKKI